VNSFFLKKVTSLLEVAVNKDCGKTLSESKLRFNMIWSSKGARATLYDPV